MHRGTARLMSFFMSLTLLFGGFLASASAESLLLWHSYRGQERKALEKIVDQWNAGSPEMTVELLAVPYDAFADRITAAVPRGKGPDLFIFAHDRIGGWAESEIIEPIEFWVDEELQKRFLPVTMEAVTYKDSIYALPVAAKTTLLFYNKALVKTPPKTTDELIALAKSLTDKDKGKFGLAYENANFYFHACWHLGYGGQVFDKKGNPALNTPEAVQALQFASDLDRKHGILPTEITNILVTTLFNQGEAAMVINGPWFRGEIADGVDYGVAPLPTISGINTPAKPFLTSEGIILSARSEKKEAAFEFMTYFTSPEAALIMALEGQQTSAIQSVWKDAKIQADPALPIFRQQLDNSIPMPNTADMLSVWTPATTAMAKVILGTMAPKTALDEAQASVLESLQLKRR